MQFTHSHIRGLRCSGPQLMLPIYPPIQILYNCRHAPYGLMFHSDCESQYTASTFRQLLDSLKCGAVLFQKGCPFDNAVCECFFKYLKREETNRRTYHTFNELHLFVFEYIEGHYNTRRPHVSLNYLTPNEMEDAYRRQSSCCPLLKNFTKTCLLY